MPAPGCTRNDPVPCRAQDRLPPLQPCPWTGGISHPHIPGLLPPGAPRNSTAAGAPAHRVYKRPGLLGERGWWWLLWPPHSALALSLVPQEQSFAQRSRLVVRSVPSQSHHIGDSFPSHVLWMVILSAVADHVTPFVFSCCPPALSHQERRFWLLLCVPRGLGLPPAFPGGTLPPYRDCK